MRPGGTDPKSLTVPNTSTDHTTVTFSRAIRLCTTGSIGIMVALPTILTIVRFLTTSITSTFRTTDTTDTMSPGVLTLTIITIIRINATVVTRRRVGW